MIDSASLLGPDATIGTDNAQLASNENTSSLHVERACRASNSLECASRAAVFVRAYLARVQVVVPDEQRHNDCAGLVGEARDPVSENSIFWKLNWGMGGNQIA